MIMLEKTLERYPKGYKRVVSRAVNKVAGNARTKISKEIRARLGIKVAELHKRNLVLRKANFSRLNASIKIRGGRIPLIRFMTISKAKKNKGIFQYRLGPRGASTQIRGAFVSTMRSGHKGVFKRVDGKQMQTRQGPLNKHTQAITELRGPSVPEKFHDVAAFAAGMLDNTIATRLQQELETQLDVFMSQVS
jgi:hypothetical protein